MANVVRLEPQAALPESHSVVVLRRFDETDPRLRVIHVVVRDATGHETSQRAVREDGGIMDWDEAIRAGRAQADAAGLPDVLVIDRTAGPRAQEVLRHGGDHSFSGDKLDDTDLEEGERGADMRDRQPT